MGTLLWRARYRLRRRPGFLGHRLPVRSLRWARRASVLVSDHLHILAVKGPSVSAKILWARTKMEGKNIVRCDLSVFHVTQAQADGITVIVSVGIGTMMARICAICRGGGGGTGTRVRKQNSGSRTGQTFD